ncbi:MAG: SRPBCC domain-containing protein [Deltaproteobacteria bacterium]|nr:SRPBCC domain-containing protein [Deltaproteobacteria bacterium]
MADILHRVEIEASPDKVYQAVSEQSGFTNWWTPRCEAEPRVGSIAKFRFRNGSIGPDMEVLELIPNKKVVWRCVKGDPQWVGTEFTFDIQPHARGAVLFFGQRGWKEASEFYMHCNCKWAFFLGVSLKKYLETGTGMPHPQDPDF